MSMISIEKKIEKLINENTAEDKANEAIDKQVKNYDAAKINGTSGMGPDNFDPGDSDLGPSAIEKATKAAAEKISSHMNDLGDS